MSTRHFNPADATDGVKGSKPRFKSAREELPQINRDYLKVRTRKLRAQAFLAEAHAREKAGELISRRLAGLQAAFLLGNFRSRVLAEPQSLARRLLQQGLIEEKSEHSAQQVIREAFHGMLRELSELPSKVMQVADSNWASKIDDDLKAQVDRIEGRLDPSKAKPRPSKPKSGARRRPRRCANCAPGGESLDPFGARQSDFLTLLLM